MLETERLYLIPLTAHQIKLWAEDVPGLEKELDCLYRGEQAAGDFLDVIKGQQGTVEKDSANWLYHTFWLFIRKEDRVVVGSAGFKGIPSAEKEVEIGYGLGKEHEHKGYMTEAVQALSDWALKQEKVLHVIAETEPENLPSQNVLKRCGFSLYKTEATLWWRK